MTFPNFQIANFDLFSRKEHLFLNNQIFHPLHTYHLNRWFQEEVKDN